MFAEFLEDFGSGCYAFVTLALEHVVDCFLEVPASEASPVDLVTLGLCAFVHRRSPFVGIFQPGERAEKEDWLACQSMLLKVSLVQGSAISGSRFCESFMIACCGSGAVHVVIMWDSCFLVTNRPWWRRPASRLGIHSGKSPVSWTG